MSPEYEISAAARHAARTILKNFDLREKASIKATERNVAIIVDVCTQVFRVERVLDHMVRTVPWSDRQELARNLEQLRAAVRAVEVVRNSMPKYTSEAGIVVRKEEVELKLTKEQLNRARQFAQQVAAARTVEDQQALLQRAGVVKIS